MTSLGIDGGASSAKWTLIDEKRSIIAQGNSGSIDGHLYRSESLQRFKEFLNEVRVHIGDLRVNAVTLGITGYGSAELLEETINTVFPSANIQTSTDISLAFRGECELGVGIYLYAGTGSIAIHISKDNEEITSGGWGYLLGDEGGGYWIGREALRHLALNSESGTQLDLLSRSVSDVIGGSTWKEIRAFTYSNNRSEIAQLSKTVAELCEAGDISATRIVKEAANQLADLIKRLERRIQSQSQPIIFGGGLSNAIPLLRMELETLLGRPLALGESEYSLAAANLGLMRLKTSSLD